MAAEPGLLMLSGRQIDRLNPYIRRSIGWPGAVNVSATFMSTISTVPSGSARRRIADRACTG